MHDFPKLIGGCAGRFGPRRLRGRRFQTRGHRGLRSGAGVVSAQCGDAKRPNRDESSRVNPTAPMTVAATPSNVDDSGAKTPSTEANPPRNDCTARPARF